jgi:hypothetical protein
MSPRMDMDHPDAIADMMFSNGTSRRSRRQAGRQHADEENPRVKARAGKERSI